MHLDKEIWSDVKGMEGYYKISNHGRVKSFITTRQIITDEFIILKPFKSSKNYLCVSLFRKDYRIHRLVAEHFIPNPNNLPQVNHKDKNKANNHISNLEWINNRENMVHAYDSKFPGIYETKSGNFALKIFFNKKQQHIGTYKSKESALEARLKFLNR